MLLVAYYLAKHVGERELILPVGYKQAINCFLL